MAWKDSLTKRRTGMTKEEREQLQSVLDYFDHREDECIERVAFLDEHHFDFERQAWDIKCSIYRECFRELKNVLDRMTVDGEASAAGVKHKYKVGDKVHHINHPEIVYGVEKIWDDGTYRIVPINGGRVNAIMSATEDCMAPAE